MKPLILATHNQHKVQELNTLLQGTGYEAIPLGLDGPTWEESGETFQENAQIKAHAVWRPGKTVLADDSGLVVPALGGAPGVYSARFARVGASDRENTELLLKRLGGIAQRDAAFICHLTLILPNGTNHHFTGKLEGHIALKAEGSAGFGYDPVFIPKGSKESFASLGSTFKNQISHRSRAMAELKTFLLG